MKFSPNKDLVLACAGVFQSAVVVQQLAKLDDYDNDALHHSSFSLLRLDGARTEDIFGGTEHLRTGLRSMAKLLAEPPKPQTQQLFQYVMGMCVLSKKLAQNVPMQEIIEPDLEKLRAEYLSAYADFSKDDSLHADLAELYANTISHMQPRVMVYGEDARLRNTLVVNRIRAAIFAGIRAAWLWHKLGGRRWHFLFARKAYCRAALGLLG